MTTLYRFYDPDGVLLYVGITDNWLARREAHAHRKPWWPTIRTATFEHYPTRVQAAIAEQLAIGFEHPRYNIVHNRASV